MNTILTSFKKESIIGCSIHPDPYVKEARLENGLVKGHAYTITNFAIVDLAYKTEKLLRIRNPWVRHALLISKLYSFNTNNFLI